MTTERESLFADREDSLSVPVTRSLDELRQTCSAPSDAYSAGVWCEAANDAVLLAVRFERALREIERIRGGSGLFPWDAKVSGIARAALRAAGGRART